MSADKNKRFAPLASFFAYFIFGLSFMASRITMEHSSPTMLLALRFLASFLVVLILPALGIVKINLKGKPILPPILLGLFQPVIYFIGETNGIKYTNSSFSGIMISLIPAVTVLFSAIFLKEKLQIKKLLWITCSIIGVVLPSVSQGLQGSIQLKGFLYLLLAIAAAGYFPILSKSMADQFSSYERTFITMLTGCVVFTGFGIIKEKAAFFPQLVSAVKDPYVILPMLYLAVASSVVAFFLLNYAMTYMDAGKATAFANITPVVSVLAGCLILGEPFSVVQAAGMVLILLGVYMVNRAA